MTNILQNFISELLKMYLAPTKSELELKLPATQAETSFLRLVFLLFFYFDCGFDSLSLGLKPRNQLVRKLVDAFSPLCPLLGKLQIPANGCGHNPNPRGISMHHVIFQIKENPGLFESTASVFRARVEEK